MLDRVEYAVAHAYLIKATMVGDPSRNEIDYGLWAIDFAQNNTRRPNPCYIPEHVHDNILYIFICIYL